jgi:GNAT superfamily N-acetyltransferase
MPMKRIIDIANEHILAVQAWLSSRTPNARQFKGTGVTVSSGGLPFDLSNLALGACYPPAISDDQIDEEIEATKRFFSERNVPWIWWLGPNTQPPDMLQRLKEHGLTGNAPLPAMVAALPSKRISLNPDVTVWLAKSRSDLEAASHIRRAAFDLPVGTPLSYFEDMAEDWLRNDPARLYLARVRYGPPASIGALIMGEGYPGIYLMTTTQEWRRKGLGKAILNRILEDATPGGHQMIMLTASNQGFPLYQKFGFEHLFDYQVVRKQ